MALQRQAMEILTLYLLCGTVALLVGLLLLQTAADPSLRQRRRKLKSVRTQLRAPPITNFVTLVEPEGHIRLEPIFELKMKLLEFFLLIALISSHIHVA